LEKYLKEAKQSKKESLHSWKTLVAFFKDPFYKAKLQFFISVGQEIEPFLRKFQSPNPMAPLFFEELLQILTQLLRRVLKTTFFDHFGFLPTRLKLEVALHLNSLNL
jgi:tRNA U34 5-methylaminomethyl-2-thiouridine-forming methyltransferase MnmC